MQVVFIRTTNEKFAYAYAIEKAVLSESAQINLYEKVEESCKKFSELRWLLAEGRSEIDVEELDKRIKFRVSEGELDALELPEEFASVEFHLFPSKRLKRIAEYIKFLLTLQGSRCRKCVIIDEIGGIESNLVDPVGLILSMFPPESILTVTSDLATRQFELQRKVDRRIVETVKMEWSNDRMRFFE